MTKPVALSRLRNISKQRSIRMPRVPQRRVFDRADEDEALSVEWPVQAPSSLTE